MATKSSVSSSSSSSSSSSARSSLFFFSGFDECHESHFLDACNLCSKPLGFNSDIYMYRGNTPFCSKECRQEQINMDVAKEKSWKVSSRSLRKSEQSTNSSTTKKTVRTGTVAVA